ncbi:NAD(P)H-binding protein [Methylophaga lonarensis]|uniref:NAD(P)H-binding protein n=1 Tax=Methylophaga lonarensis TaxID=999151 RepID=UPI000347B8D6|nr:NAD(P)H-binding protein [Methylophaga lonarensis]
MDKTLVIGANGQIGKQLVQQMSGQSMPVRVMLRSQDQASFFTVLGAEVVIADLEQPLPDTAFADCDKVVFTAGSGGKTGADKTILVDLVGCLQSRGYGQTTWHQTICHGQCPKCR